MNTKNLEYFIKVVDTGTFSKAAEESFISQSAISQAIKSLEDELGYKLMIRNKKGFELTEAGNILYKYTSSSMELLETGLSKLKSLQSLDSGELIIGASDTISTYFLLPHLEMFHKLYPNIRIQVINRVTSETIELLKSRQN